MQSFFITGAGTDIGKTLVTTTLCWQLRQQGKKVTALKPVITGYDAENSENDTALILKSCGIAPTPSLADSISPWRYKAALAPNLAAAREKKSLALEKVVTFCRDHTSLASDVVLVEGAGGVMAPLSDTHTTLDWIQALAWPVILVGGSYLGAISHTLTAVEALLARKAGIRALIVSESLHSPVSLADTAATVEKFVPPHVPVVKLPRLHGKEELWKTAPPISWICDE